MTEDLAVSCIIPTYHRCDTLKRAIDSVLAQTYDKLTVIVVDDNVPNDEYSQKVQEVIRCYADNEKVKYFQQEKHINGAVARNFGVQKAESKYIAFLDDDDEWLPNKIEMQIKYLQENPDCKGCSVLYSILKNGNEIKRCREYNNHNLQFKVLKREVAIYTSTFLCEKNSFLSFGGFDEELQRHQDLQMFVCFLESNNIGVLNEYLTIIHADSIINRPTTEKLICVKQQFFTSIQSILSRYKKKECKRIKKAHYFEIAVSSLKEKKYRICLQYIFKIGFSPISFYDVLKRIKNR